jgi:anti-sigma factor RsiW
MNHGHEEHVNCRELADAITEYIDDELTPQDRQLIDRHLGMCGGCKNYLEQMEATVATVASLRGSSPPPETKQKLLGLFRKWKNERGEG